MLGLRNSRSLVQFLFWYYLKKSFFFINCKHVLRKNFRKYSRIMYLKIRSPGLGNVHVQSTTSHCAMHVDENYVCSRDETLFLFPFSAFRPEIRRLYQNVRFNIHIFVRSRFFFTTGCDKLYNTSETKKKKKSMLFFVPKILFSISSRGKNRQFFLPATFIRIRQIDYVLCGLGFSFFCGDLSAPSKTSLFDATHVVTLALPPSLRVFLSIFSRYILSPKSHFSIYVQARERTRVSNKGRKWVAKKRRQERKRTKKICNALVPNPIKRSLRSFGGTGKGVTFFHVEFCWCGCIDMRISCRDACQNACRLVWYNQQWAISSFLLGLFFVLSFRRLRLHCRLNISKCACAFTFKLQTLLWIGRFWAWCCARCWFLHNFDLS